jgi:hypothetical protein
MFHFLYNKYGLVAHLTGLVLDSPKIKNKKLCPCGLEKEGDMVLYSLGLA